MKTGFKTQLRPRRNTGLTERDEGESSRYSGEGAGVPRARRRNSGARISRWQFAWPVVVVRAVLILGLLYPVMAVFSGRRTYGAERLDSVAGPVIFASNHLSVADNPAILLALPWRRRLRLATAAAEGVMRSRGRFQSFCAALISNGFYFSQSGAIRSSLLDCERLVKDGWSLLYFPEGMRSDDGNLRPFKPGIGLLATRLDVPVVPVYLKGTDTVLAKGGSHPRRGNIEVRFGEPLLFSWDASHDEVARQIRCSVASLSQKCVP